MKAIIVAWVIAAREEKEENAGSVCTMVIRVRARRFHRSMIENVTGMMTETGTEGVKRRETVIAVAEHLK
ncbi:MAG: hypothetical protein IJ429_03990 [Lachnospiraceae bacterium]|nr:hypothetical protein [Lachnospiraceae bacterium]